MKEKLGKIAPPLFNQLIGTKLGKNRREVLAGPQFGVDVSVVELPGEMVMLSTSDPLSLLPTLGLEESAWLSVQLMAHDMATTGLAPMYGQFVLNLPSTFSKTDFKIYWDYIHRFCSDIGIAITGGHTGFIEGQNSTIAGGGTLVAIAPKDGFLLSRYARSGDVVLVTKSCAVSSTAILAMAFPETVRNKVGVDIHQQACSTFYHTSSLQDALVAAEMENGQRDITAMHDVTEGGVLGALYELATASNNGAKIYHEKLPIGHVQKEICQAFSLDPRYCIGAGSMIIACKKSAANRVINRLKQKDIACVEVGELVDRQEGIRIIDGQMSAEVDYPEDDPYWEAYFRAYTAGWN